MKIPIKRFDKSLPLPRAEGHGHAAFDLPAREDITINPHQIGLSKLNSAIAVPPGYVLLLFSRSSTPLRKGLILANSVGVVDPFFSGDSDELVAMWYNITDQPVKIERGEILIQGLFVKFQDIELQEVQKMPHDGTGYWAVDGTKGKNIPTHLT